MDVFSRKRREPRVRLRTCVRIEGTTHDQDFSYETVTLDISPHGASIVVDEALPLGAKIEFIALKYPFRAVATVRSVTTDSSTGKMVLGLEYPDEQRNPLVIWSAVESENETQKAALRTETESPVG